MKDLLTKVPQVGRLEWIGLRTGHRQEVESAETAEVKAGVGLLGDHRSMRENVKPESKRQVTLIQAEHLDVIAALAGLEKVDPAWLRRNLLISGINLLALKDQRFYIGEVLLEGTGLCHPCSRMEETLGPGGYNAMRGHGGIMARILSGGKISVGDQVKLLHVQPNTFG